MHTIFLMYLQHIQVHHHYKHMLLIFLACLLLCFSCLNLVSSFHPVSMFSCSHMKHLEQSYFCDISFLRGLLLWNCLLSLTKVTVHNFTLTGHIIAYHLLDQFSHQFPQNQQKVDRKVTLAPSSPSLLQVREVPQYSEGKVVLKPFCIHHFLQTAA